MYSVLEGGATFAEGDEMEVSTLNVEAEDAKEERA
jgi:hypothetical protein